MSGRHRKEAGRPGSNLYPMATAETATYALFEKDRELKVSDGTPIRYTVRGPGRARGHAIVLANGWSCSDAYWVEILPRLVAAGHRVILPDTRGHGESGLPRDPGRRARNLTEDDLSVERLAADLIEVCQVEQVTDAVFVGHSMGVQTILECYRAAPDLSVASSPSPAPTRIPSTRSTDGAFGTTCSRSAG